MAEIHDAQFLEVWNGSNSVGEVAAKLSLEVSKVRAWSQRLRKRGVNLKKMRKELISDNQFIELWLKSSSFEQFLDRTKLSSAAAKQRFSAFVKNGVPLLRFLDMKRRKKNWDELRIRAEEILKSAAK
jgi:hypothetical protein